MLKRHLAIGLAMGLMLLGCKKDDDKDSAVEGGGFITAADALTPPTTVEEIAADDLEAELLTSEFLGNFGGSSYKSFTSCMELFSDVLIVSDDKNMKIVAEKSIDACDMIFGLTLKNVVLNIFASATCNGESNWAQLNGKKYGEMESDGEITCTGGGTDLFSFRMKGITSFMGTDVPMVNSNGRMTRDGKACTITSEGENTKVGDGCMEFSKTTHDGSDAPGSFEIAEFQSVLQNSDDEVISGTIKFTLNNWTGTLTVHSREKVDYELTNGTETKTGTLDFSTPGGENPGETDTETPGDTGTQLRWNPTFSAAF